MNKFTKIEKKWQKIWSDEKCFESKKNKKPKFYNLEMFPYPSGTGLHTGHARNFTIGDSLSRYKRLKGFNVLYPMGWDSFGLPSENEAIKRGVHPTKSIAQNIKTFKKQMSALGLSYDWNREVTTHHPDYYKWNQWLFLQLYKNGLAYQKESLGNWCPSCKTTLANEDVKDGECWRCDSEVEQKQIKQWFFKITEFSEDLLKGLDKINWSNHLKTLQKNWIGKSEGVEINFKLENNEKLNVYTTRPDTIYGATFLVLAPEHELVKNLIKKNKLEEYKKFKNKVSKQNERDRISKEKIGMFTGSYAINPITNEKIPIYLANFVLLGYGTGAIMSVPGHDKRDFEFAKKYNLKVKYVIDGENNAGVINGDGTIINSDKYNGLSSIEFKKQITDFILKNKLGKIRKNYRIRDWNVSRQRYWGTPIPIIHCDDCGIVEVPEKDLPVELPKKVDYNKPARSPLDTNLNFVNVKCPICKSKAKRETDTMTTFVDSAWYFLRYTDPKNNSKIFDKNKTNYWMPVDQYIGGIEHAVGHLLYSRFITKFLKKIGYLNFDEPFTNLLNQGMVLKDGSKMSKSKGNVVDPLEMISKYGSDSLRTYLLFIAAPESPFEWSDKDIQGVNKFLLKILNIPKLKLNKNMNEFMNSLTSKKIDEIEKHYDNKEFNRVIISLMDFFNFIEKYPSKYSINSFLSMLYPIAPHISEEINEKLGNKKIIGKSNWPKIKYKFNKSDYEKGMQVEKLVSDINNIEKLVDKKIKKVYLYVIPPELKQYSDLKNILENRLNKNFIIESISSKDLYDPENKSKRAKFGKPAIYVE